MERDFKGIWISKEIWVSKDLSLQEKVFLVEISSLDNEEGCFASNSYFADFFGVSKTRVSIVINSLVKKGYINSTIIYKEGSKQILKRVLKESYRGYARKVIEPIKQKFIDNNTVNNTSNNIINKDKSIVAVKKKNVIIDKLELENISDDLKVKLKEFLEYRKQIKKPYKTYRPIKTLINGIGSKFIDEEHLIRSIDNSMDQEYQGVFPLKQYTKDPGNNVSESFASKALRGEVEFDG